MTDSVRTGLLLCFVLLAGCAGSPQRRSAAPSADSSEEVSSGAISSKVRKECEDILGTQWKGLSEEERVPQETLLFAILSSVHHNKVAGPKADWGRLSETVGPIVLDVLSREDPKKEQAFAQLFAMRLVVPLDVGREAAPLLKKKLISDQSHRKIVRDAIETLGLIGDPAAIPDVGPFLSPLPLPGEMSGGQDLVTPCYAALALHRLGDDSGMPFLKQLLSHPAQSVQEQAAMTLADMGDPSGIPVFEARLRNPAANKAYVIQAVGQLKTPEARKILERTIQFDSPELAQISAVYLAEQGDSNGNRLLERELKETDLKRSFNAARRLARLGDASAVPFLEEHYQDIDIERRIAAGAALASFGSGVGFKDLYEGLQEKRWGYRAASAAFIFLLTGE